MASPTFRLPSLAGALRGAQSDQGDPLLLNRGPHCVRTAVRGCAAATTAAVLLAALRVMQGKPVVMATRRSIFVDVVLERNGM